MQKNKQIIILLILSAVAIVFWDTVIIYPIKLFVVFLHELSHGIAAIVTGGKIVKFEITYLIGGTCYTIGGNSFIIASAGYLGSILLGGLLLLRASKSKDSRIIGISLSIIILLITLVYVRNQFGFFFGISFTVLLLLLSLFLPKKIFELVLKFIGIVSCLYVLVDIKEDLFTLDYRGSDADYLQSITGIPAIVWGVLWGIIAIIAFLYFIKKSIKSTS
jgi:hypothetical protein